ncbi:hypothetical protein OG339_11875 [Streptosporangium sp. NBC_01495]|uniref:hypothetical protein n=1 Tax=Streptosporangium sp. NBC_01495 TaxID=2903899 RepID=UPI002E2F1B5A|nr:hypothetical protein [Streptosporangium sp. NBC_01495]
MGKTYAKEGRPRGAATAHRQGRTGRRQPAGGGDGGGRVHFAFAQGLVNPALIGHYTPEAVVAAVDYHRDRLFT